MNIREKVDKEENEQLRSIPAQRLKEKLSLLGNRRESAKKRWFWELLQNASDYNESVNIKLMVSDEYVSFSHDGSPFSISDSLNIISPDSNKSDDMVHTDNIGKFGTGLVSTHILSSKMKIDGICYDDENKHYKFSISLDRGCFENKQALIDQITDSKEAFKNSLTECNVETGFQTTFSYKLGYSLPTLPILTPDEIETEYLYDTIPYTLCFMPKVKSIQVFDSRQNAKTQEYTIKRNGCSGNNISFTITQNGQSEIEVNPKS